MPLPNSGLVESDMSPKTSARRAGEVQCLGDMPWVPGDCDQARQHPSDAKPGESQDRLAEPVSGFAGFRLVAIPGVRSYCAPRRTLTRGADNFDLRIR